MGQRTVKSDDLIAHLIRLRDTLRKGDKFCVSKKSHREFSVRTRIKKRRDLDGGKV